MNRCPICKGAVEEISVSCIDIIEAKVECSYDNGLTTLTVMVCPSCTGVHLLYKSKTIRLVPKKVVSNDCEDEVRFCRDCWTRLVPDYEQGWLRCPTPGCRSKRRMDGLFGRDKRIMDEYDAMKLEMYTALSSGNVDYVVPERFKELSEAALAIKERLRLK